MAACSSSLTAEGMTRTFYPSATLAYYNAPLHLHLHLHPLYIAYTFKPGDADSRVPWCSHSSPPLLLPQPGHNHPRRGTPSFFRHVISFEPHVRCKVHVWMSRLFFTLLFRPCVLLKASGRDANARLATSRDCSIQREMTSMCLWSYCIVFGFCFLLGFSVVVVVVFFCHSLNHKCFNTLR